MARLMVPLAFCCLLCAADSARGQYLQRYQPPYGPTLSPYLEYYRRPTGVLDNYHMFVRPRVDLRQTLRVQQRQILSLEREALRTGAEVSQIREAGVAPTGTGSGYMNYSHYYPAAVGRR